MHALKHMPGQIVGIQNILPQYADAPKSIFFAERGLVTQVIELEVDNIRNLILDDAEKLK